MNLQELGGTGERIPDVGLGTWAYTGGSAPLRRGVELGAFLIDTAEAYRTEDAVGEAIAGIRGDVFVATKVSPSHFRRRDVHRAADESLKRLQCGVIDLYQLHWPNARIPIAETMGAMEELVEAGKVRYIGVSNFSVSEMQEAQAVLSKSRIASNQVEYSLTDRSIEAEVLPYCQINGITVIAYSPLARGLNNFGRGAKALEDVAARNGRTAAQVALNWCLTHDRVMVIPKSNSAARIEENCAASGWQLPDEDIAALETAFPPAERKRRFGFF
ncbi:MAG: aldo/keto reductase [Chloroflexota bacterium]|nr:aldo/keto reductase [Chloroflexota bacterium]